VDGMTAYSLLTIFYPMGLILSSLPGLVEHSYLENSGNTYVSTNYVTLPGSDDFLRGFLKDKTVILSGRYLGG